MDKHIELKKIESKGCVVKLVNLKGVKKLVIPQTYNGYNIESICYIEDNELEEVEFPDTLIYINNEIMNKLNKTRKLVFNIDIGVTIKSFKNLEEVVILKPSTAGNLTIDFRNNPKLSKVKIDYDVYNFNGSAFADCPSLEVQPMLKEGLVFIGEQAFYNIKDTEITLPKSVIEISIESFKSENTDNIIINVQNRHACVYFFDEDYEPKCTIKGVTSCYYPLSLYEFIETPSEVEKKVLRLKLLGYNIDKHSIAHDYKDLYGSLLLCNDKDIAERIDGVIMNTISYIICYNNLISNYYNCVTFEIPELETLISECEPKDIKVYKMQKNTIILAKNKVIIYNKTKDYLLSLIDDWSGGIMLQEKVIDNIPLRQVKNIKEINNNVIITLKSGKIISVDMNKIN